MKVKNLISKEVIDVSEEHFGEVLSRQGWIQYVELLEELKKEVAKNKPSRES